MSDLQDLSLVLYIFLVTKTYDSNSSKECETSFKDFLFCDEGEIVKVCKEYITKIIEEVKSKEGELVKVCEEYITKIIEEAKSREGEIVEVSEEDITKIIVKVCEEYIIKIIKEAKGREGEIVKVCEEYIIKIIKEAKGREGEIVKVCEEYITKIIEEVKGREGKIVEACKKYIIKIIEEVKVREGEIVEACKKYIIKIIKEVKGREGETVEACKKYIIKIIKEVKGREGEIVKVCEEDITKIIVKVCKEYITKIIEEVKGREGEMAEACKEYITKIIEEVKVREGEIVEACKKYIIKIIKEAKGKEGEIKVYEEDRLYVYLTYSNDNLAIIESYNNIKIDELKSKINELNSRINSTRQECLSNNDPFSGYALLTSATISSKHECNADEIASEILNIYNSNSNHNTEISSVDLPTKSTTKQFIKLFSLTYGGEENILYRSLILCSDRSEEFTRSYFYQIIPKILMYSYKVKYIYKCFEEYREKIEEEYKHKNTTHTTNDAENLENKKTNLRKGNTAQEISDLEKKLEHLETAYNNQYKLVNSLSQLVFAAEVNFRNIQTILQVHNIPRKLLFEYCFYKTESKIGTMKFYHRFHYKENDKIKSDIKRIETRSNILRNKLENAENRQSEIRNIILAIIAAIIAFFELVNDELVALLFVRIFGISLSATYIFIVKIVLAAFSLIIPILIYYKVRLGND
jgi:signal peptidase I